jgi:chemotaxis methyl-accepting protein methylase
MAMELRKKATLGELIEAVTNEVSRVTRGSTNTNVLVSHIVRDLFTTRRVRLKRRRVLKIA